MSVRGAVLPRRTLSALALFIFAIASSSPLTVLVGGVPATFASTGVVGTPLSFAVVAVAVWLLAVGLVAMAREVPHPAPFYALWGRGLSPTAGVAACCLSWLGYNTILTSLYGLLAPNLAQALGGTWQGWAVVVWLVIGGLGLLGGRATAVVLGGFLAVELGVNVCFIVAGFAHPAGGVIHWDGLDPSYLMVGGVSGVLAYGMAAVVGIETPPVFGEEARPRGVERALLAAVLVAGALYLLVSLAYEVWTGPDQVQQAAADPHRQPFSLLAAVFGPSVIAPATLLLVTSIVASMSAFHATAARYALGGAREGWLWSRLGGVSRARHGGRGGAPIGGSLLQSATSAILLAAFMVFRADPLRTIFPWLSSIGAVSVLVLLIVTALAARRWFLRGGGTTVSVFVRQVAPVAGSVLGFLLLVMTVVNQWSILGVARSSPRPWLIPGLVAVTVLVGLAWGALLRRRRPQVWQAIGYSTPDALTVKDDRLSLLDV